MNKLSLAHKASHRSGKRKPVPFKNLTGHRFNRLVVRSFAGRDHHKQIVWWCECTCGNGVAVVGNSLKTGNSTSCGCARQDCMKGRRQYPGNTLQERTKAKRLAIFFNLSLEEHGTIFTFQKGLCAITGKPSTKLVTDHEHKTGLVRGLLDWKINRALEAFRDDPLILRKAADYLENPTAPQALGERVYGVLGSIGRKAKNRRYGPDGTKEPQSRRIRIHSVFRKGSKQTQ